MRFLPLALLMLGEGCAPKSVPRAFAPGPASRPRASVLDALDRGAVTPVHFARRTLYSWTTAKGASTISSEGQALRHRIHVRPPDDAFYDLHLRRTSDASMRALLTAPPFDRVRYAWATPWGAVDGLGDEKYGDRLIRVVLREDALIARFVPLTESDGDPEDPNNPFRLGLPEWSFVRTDGTPVSRDVALDRRDKIAAVFHVSVNRDATYGRYLGYREYVLVNESSIERLEIGSEETAGALSASHDLLRALIDRDGVPEVRADDDRFLARHAIARGGMHAGFSSLSLEERWLLTLPFPRAQYRDLHHLLSAIDEASRVKGEGVALVR